MRYCIPVYGDRIAPRCTIAEALLIVRNGDGRAHVEARVPLQDHTWLEITELLVLHRVTTLICGGLSRESRSALADLGIAVIANVATKIVTILRAIAADDLHPGFGLEPANPVDRLLGASPEGDDGRAREQKPHDKDEPREGWI